MKKIVLLVLMSVLFWPMEINANQYKSRKISIPENPVKSPDASYVNVDLGETTGILTLLCVGNVGSMEVTISQNGVTIENDVIAVSNGQSVIYNMSGYAIGEYLLTIETADGAITQYIIYVEDD